MGFPHARGDVPISCVRVVSYTLFSPRAWGCSGWSRREPCAPAVFPTRVGMFRSTPWPKPASTGFPHARGDVPLRGEPLQWRGQFSPRAWGCSGNVLTFGSYWDVFPTRVGMFRTPAGTCQQTPCFPHARGDVPAESCCETSCFSFSPRAWGCSITAPQRSAHLIVFPTRVGMFRTPNLARSPCVSFPHARGDVPNLSSINASPPRFSPRAWGCSDMG